MRKITERRRESLRKSSKKYDEKYHSFNLRIPLADKEMYLSLAEADGKSFNQYLIDLIKKDIEERKMV